MGVSLFTLTVLSDTEWVKESLIEQLQPIMGGPIQIETLNLDLFPSPAANLEGLAFETQTPNIVAFRAKRVEVGIGWQSLWQRNLLVNHIMIDEPDLAIAIPLVTTPEEPITEPLPAIRKMGIRNGQIHLLRKSASQTTLALNWEAVHFTITEAATGGPYSIHLSTQIPDPKLSSALTLNGKLTFLESNEASHLNKEFTPIPPIKIQGQIEGSHLNLGRLVQFINGRALEQPIHAQANVQGNFLYTFQEDTDYLDVPDFQISIDDWTLTGQARIADMLYESTRLHISGSSSPLVIKRLSSLFPPDWIPEGVRTILSDHQVVGSLALERGSFHIPLSENDSWDAEGILRVKDGQFLPSPGQPLLTDVSGLVTFSPSHLQFSQVRGNITPLTITFPKATLALEDETVRLSVPTFQISEHDWSINGTAGFINLPNAPPVLTVSGSALPISIQYLSKIIPEAWLPFSVRTILNERNIDGEMEFLTGSVKWIGDEANAVMTEGVIRISNGQVLFDPNHPTLTNIYGGIAFDSNLIRVLDAEGTIDASHLFVNEATLEWKDSDLWIDIYGKGALEAHDVYQALLRDFRIAPFPEALSHYHDAQGNIHVSTHIQGPLSNLSQSQILAGKLLLDNIRLFPTSNSLPLRQLNGELAFDNQGIRIQRFNGQLGKSPVDIKGQWSFLKDSQASNLTIASHLAATDLQALVPVIRENLSTLEGPIETTLSLSGPTLRPVYQAQFDLTNTAITAKGTFHKQLGVPAVFEAKGTIKENKALSMTTGKLSMPPYTLEAQGRLSWSDPPYIRGFFQTESGSGTMFPQGVIIGDGTLSLSSLSITWGLEGKNWDWTTWAMKGKVEGSNRNAQSTTTNTNQEVQSASIQWAQKNQKGKGKITLKGIPIESLLVSQNTSPPPLTGTTFLTTSLFMDLDSPEQMQRSVTGKGNVQLQKGLIQTGPVLSKILSILNVQSVLTGKVNLFEEGLPFDELSGTFSIDKGLLTTKDLALKSPVLKLSAAGSYELPTESLDAIVAVSPFGAYSNLLKDIPLFGSLMKGERKGFLTALFTVKGPRTKPEVTYQPLDSFTGGLKGLAQFPIDVLKNIITLPIPDKQKTKSGSPTK